MKLQCPFQFLPEQQDKKKHNHDGFKFDISVSDVSEKNVTKEMYK